MCSMTQEKIAADPKLDERTRHSTARIGEIASVSKLSPLKKEPGFRNVNYPQALVHISV
jgi:hypothetical protein